MTSTAYDDQFAVCTPEEEEAFKAIEARQKERSPRGEISGQRERFEASTEVESMAQALEHAAFVCASYAHEHENPERAMGARAVGSCILSKADALRAGTLTPAFITDTRGIRSVAPKPEDA
ncbi:hypothetical protein [Halomonas sp. MS1]|nr:hypothetical protein [Halomonas sp. MS1]UTD55903.1 hypothetical protein NF683_01405 [Halomonas sp. MS1]